MADRIVNPASLTEEWLDVSVDLTPYAGKTILLTIENKANNWRNEWAYWNEIKIVHE